MSKKYLWIRCPACMRHGAFKIKGYVTVYRCAHCGAIHGSCALGESYNLVLPEWHPHPDRVKREKYFDLHCFGSKNIVRRHGWFDPKTRRIVQVG